MARCVFRDERRILIRTTFGERLSGLGLAILGAGWAALSVFAMASIGADPWYVVPILLFQVFAGVVAVGVGLVPAIKSERLEIDLRQGTYTGHRHFGLSYEALDGSIDEFEQLWVTQTRNPMDDTRTWCIEWVWREGRSGPFRLLYQERPLSFQHAPRVKTFRLVSECHQVDREGILREIRELSHSVGVPLAFSPKLVAEFGLTDEWAGSSDTAMGFGGATEAEVVRGCDGPESAS